VPGGRLIGGTDTCWDLAVSLAAHHAGGNKVAVERANPEIFQVSTISALVAGAFDGDTPYAEIMKHGDFGVGTFNALDGEMAALDGNYYHLHADGSVSDVDPAGLTPFAAVAFFRADAEIDIETPHSRAALLALMDETIPSENLFFAVRIDGLFSAVRTRTAARQTKPYPRLVETTKSQVEHTFSDVRGTVVGFRAPRYAQGMTVAGYHLHFIDDSRTVGGHVLDLGLESGTVTLDKDAELHVEMPTNADFLATIMDSDDIAAEIEKSENSSG
jgi:acetolactate decarboxylase